ncbi:ribokinase [Jiella sp. MQZ9-1]|uniref:Ribokinase n=1 Tax=Jiella flava TaxID=2816857 RepID=A0A939G3D5_9HYPH|nr:ribokinase [Jiella flava]MBO0664334.1 ribokinase [Jiella flava]MCD2472970.1 ribokinase [Jiella flava]
MSNSALSGPTVFVFGSVNIDLVCRVAAIPRPGETVLSARYEQLFGGKGANQAVAAARSGGRGKVAFAGAVGDDDLGRAARGALEAERIDTTHLRLGGERTGCAFITIDARGENAITVASGANSDARAAAIDASSWHAETVLVLQMEIPLAESLAAARRAKAAGGRVVVNLAPVPADLRTEDLAALLATSDVLVVNETELAAAARLTQVGQVGQDAPETMAAALAARSAITVIATCGGDGVLVADAAGAAGPVTRLAALTVDVVDTTGAGDTFVGVFASAFAAGDSVLEAARRAVAAASLACQKLGAQTAMPRAAEIDAALARRRP